jgi:hypothetical protein
MEPEITFEIHLIESDGYMGECFAEFTDIKEAREYWDNKFDKHRDDNFIIYRVTREIIA